MGGQKITMAKKKTEEYSAKDIFVLKGLEPVRKRPGMYIGSTGIDGLHHLIWECVDNSLDEAMAGHADEIEVSLLPKNYVRVVDNGRGIPVDIHPQTKKSALETVMTTLHAGAKFGKKTYQVSGGLHGVGISVVCALSSELKAEICRGGDLHVQEFSQGKAKGKIKKTKKCKKTGTTVIFKPDKDIFGDIEFDRKIIMNHLRKQAYLTKSTKIVFSDSRDKDNILIYVFYFEGGLRSYVKHLSGNNEGIHETPFYVAREKEGILVEAAFQYTQERESLEESFANNIHTLEGGTHLTGFRSALTRALNEYAKKNDYIKEDEEGLTGKDAREGINAAVSVKIKEPQFEGQTKAKLGNPEAKTAVEAVVYEGLTEFLEQYPQDARAVIQNALLVAKARKAASAARQTVLRKGVLDGLTLPGKLADCSCKDPEQSELFIVEGQSAGGSTKGGRDRRFQAVLPLRGKILNVERAKLTKILSSDEIRALVIALGTAIAQDFDISKLRYHRIIIATDADSVTADTPVFLYNKETKNFILTEVGKFIDNCDDTTKYQVLTLDEKDRKLRLKEIIQTIRHPLRTDLYEIKTYCGYPTKATDCHSVYIYDNEEVKTRKASELRKGDIMVFPKIFPGIEKDTSIDLRDVLFKERPQNVTLKVKELENIPNSAWIEVPFEYFQVLKQERVSAQISRLKMENLIGVGRGVIQQWEQKFDNVMPRFSYFEQYLNQIDRDINNIDYNIYVPIKDWQEEFPESAEFYYANHVHKLRTKFDLDEDLAYFLGWFLGDGCACPEKKNPNRFSLFLGKGKIENYLNELSRIIEDKFSASVIIDKRKAGDIALTFHSYEFKLLLKELGLLGKRANEKFIPDIFFNAKKEIKEALLKGLLQSDGFITVWKNRTVRYGWKLSSKDLIQGVLTLFRQLGIFASYSVRQEKDHIRNGIVFRSNFKFYGAEVTTIDYLLKTKGVWREHKDADKLEKYLKNADMTQAKGKKLREISKDFVGLEIKEVKKIKNPKDKFVYDFSVLTDQNFIAGTGGCLLHNTDGAHIRTLLLTLFYRYFRPLIEHGYIYIARPPLYKIQSGKRVEYGYTEEDKKEILGDMKKENASIQRYKGLGEMNANELWETTMNPENRVLLRVTIDDAAEADRTFDTLMGKEVIPRKKFIQTHAKNVKNLDI